MKRYFLWMSFLLGILYAAIGALGYFLLPNFIRLLIGLFTAAPFFALLQVIACAGNIVGHKISEVKKIALKGWGIFFILNGINVAFNLYEVIDTYINTFNNPFVYLLLTFLSFVPTVVYFIMALIPKSLLRDNYSFCTRCGTIVYRGSSNLIGKNTYVSLETKTQKERVGEIVSNDYKNKYDVYANVTRTSVNRSTSYTHETHYSCPNCGKVWSKKVSSNNAYTC